MKLLYEHTIRDEGGLILLRSKLRAVSRRMGYTDIQRERMELVYNEMVSNQLKFAQGSGLVQLWETDTTGRALELFALDFGPGIADIENAANDGYTTAGTMGKGLGTIGRLCNESVVYSIHEDKTEESSWHGVSVWARFTLAKSKKRQLLEYGTYTRSYQDSIFNGDHIYACTIGDQIRWLHLDGLGHGKEAADAVDGLQDIIQLDKPIIERMAILNARMQGSRGAVAIMVDANKLDKTLDISGIGDMICYLICDGVRQNVSFPQGVLGHAHRSINVVNLPFPQQAILMTASDGIRRSWTLEMFPRLWRMHPQFISLFLGYILGRNNDDKSLMVLRTAPQTK
ncbi:serine/threonine-protein kinase RsbT [bacterium BMS3Abin11]|nr:serine/threonine-protein kinase RsbT [bacterium BMS3Abin11]